jgi:hypothetical protein
MSLPVIANPKGQKRIVTDQSVKKIWGNRLEPMLFGVVPFFVGALLDARFRVQPAVGYVMKQGSAFSRSVERLSSTVDSQDALVSCALLVQAAAATC